jgi:TonB family protein
MQFLAEFRFFSLDAVCFATKCRRRAGLSLLVLLALPGMVLIPASARLALAQTPGQATPGQAADGSAAPAPGPAPAATPAADEVGIANLGGSEVTEEQLRKELVGKPLFLRGAYLGDSLSFTEHGDPTGHPLKGSFTLSGVEIDKVKLTKRKVELEGARYGMHYVAGLPDADPTKDIDWIKITPKKKVLKISIDREQVVKQKPVKEKSAKGRKGAAQGKGTSAKLQGTAEAAATPAGAEPGATTVAPGGSASSAATQGTEKAPDSPAEPAAEQAVETESEQAADPKSVTTTSSPTHATAMLRAAIDRVLAPRIDARLERQMPEFWKLYFQAKEAGVEYRPRDPKVLRSSAVDQQAKVVSPIAPDSNEFAQSKGISGRALYRTVIGADGMPAEIAVVRPIGFGLDEKAVEAIQKAKFQPAMKAGQPVAETLDLAVVFRIYSKRTGVISGEAKSAEAAPVKPGPYSVKPPPQEP